MIFTNQPRHSEEAEPNMNNSIRIVKKNTKKDIINTRVRKQNTILQKQSSQDQASPLNFQGVVPQQQQQLNKSDGVEDREEDEWNEEQNEKLNQIVSRMKKMKEEKRVKDLVLNLPSRMLKRFDKNKFQLLNDKSYYYDESTYIPMIQEFEEQEKAKLNYLLAVNNVDNNKPSNSNENDRSPIDDSNLTIKMKLAKLVHDNILHSTPQESIQNNLNSSIANNTLHPNVKDNRGSLKDENQNFQQQLQPLNLTGNAQKGNQNQNAFSSVADDASKKYITMTSISSSMQPALTSNNYETIGQLSKKVISPSNTNNNRNTYGNFNTNAYQSSKKRIWCVGARTMFNQKTKIICKKLEKTLDKMPVLHPSSPTKFTWDFINVATIMISMFYLPITIIFDFAFSAVLATPILLIIPNVLVIDVLVNLNTGYFEKGQVIKSRMRIAQNYANKNLLTDIISVMPFIFALYADTVYHTGEADADSSKYLKSFASSSAMNILKLLFVLKMRAFTQILKRIEERFTLSQQLTNLLQLMKLLVTIVMINHLFACIWVYTAKLEHEADYSTTWMTSIKIQDDSWGNKYLNAYYFTTVTMITVGYGDILPKSNAEMVLCVITMMLACCVFGYTLNEVGAIFSSFFKIGNEIKTKISIIQRFMSKKGINQKLQYQIREYLEYYWRESAEMNSEQEQDIIEQLSESLKSNLLFEANKIVLKDSSIFKGNFSKLVIEQTVPLINEIKYSPESLICSKNVQDDQSIFFIENGSVDVILDVKQKNPKPLYTLQKGECFGAYTFFTGLPRNTNIRSREFTTILKVRRSDFIQLVSNYTEDHETFNDIKDQIKYLNDYTKIGLKCQACKSSRHVLQNCQYLHYVPNKQRVINRYNEATHLQSLTRESYTRRYTLDNINIFKNSLAIIYSIQEGAEKIQIDYFQDDGSEDDETQYSSGYYNAEEDLDDANLQKLSLLYPEQQEFFDKENSGNGNNNNLNGLLEKGQQNAFRASRSKQGITSSTADITVNCHDTIEEALDEGETVLEVKRQQQPVLPTGQADSGKHKSLALEKLLSRPPMNDQSPHQEAQFLGEQKQQQQQPQQQSTIINDSKKNKSKELPAQTPIIITSDNKPPSQKQIPAAENSQPAEQSRNSLPGSFSSIAQLGGFASVIQNLGAKSAGRRGSEQLYRLKNASKNDKPSSTSTSNTPNSNILARLHAFGMRRQTGLSEESMEQADKSSGVDSRGMLKGAMRRVVNAQRVLDLQQLNPVERKIQKLLLGQGIDDPVLKQRLMFSRKISSDKLKPNKFISSALNKNSNAESIQNETLMTLMQQLLAQTQQRNQLEESFSRDTFTNNNYTTTKYKQENEDYDIFLHFDKMKSFTKYNPRFNYTSVISRFNQIIDIARKKFKSKKERNMKTKGTTIMSKSSMKGLEVPQLEPRKMSKFSPVGGGNQRGSLKNGISGPTSIERLPQSQQMQILLLQEQMQEQQQSQMQLQLLGNTSFDRPILGDFTSSQRKEFKGDQMSNTSVLGLNETVNQLVRIQLPESSSNIHAFVSPDSTVRDHIGSDNKMNMPDEQNQPSTKNEQQFIINNNVFFNSNNLNFSLNNNTNSNKQQQQFSTTGYETEQQTNNNFKKTTSQQLIRQQQQQQIDYQQQYLEDSGIDSPSLSILPHYLNMRSSNLIERQVNDS